MERTWTLAQYHGFSFRAIAQCVPRSIIDGPSFWGWPSGSSASRAPRVLLLRVRWGGAARTAHRQQLSDLVGSSLGTMAKAWEVATCQQMCWSRSSPPGSVDGSGRQCDTPAAGRCHDRAGELRRREPADPSWSWRSRT